MAYAVLCADGRFCVAAMCGPPGAPNSKEKEAYRKRACIFSFNAQLPIEQSALYFADEIFDIALLMTGNLAAGSHRAPYICLGGRRRRDVAEGRMTAES